MTALLNWAVNLGSDFEFATAPLNGLTYSIAGGVLYLAVVLLLREWMRTQEPMQLRLLFAVHNLVLCVGSFLMLVFTLLHVWFMYRGFYPNSLFDSYCDRGNLMHTRGPLWFWVYVHYLSKYYEFLDTIFLVLKKKPLMTLHVYHHAITVSIIMCGLVDNATYTWIAVVQNSFVHVLMYGYYFGAIFGYSPWWKMVQFVGNLTGLGVWLWSLRWSASCAGGWTAFIGGTTANISFFALFQLFYNRAYKEDGDTARTSRKKVT